MIPRFFNRSAKKLPKTGNNLKNSNPRGAMITNARSPVLISTPVFHYRGLVEEQLNFYEKWNLHSHRGDTGLLAFSFFLYAAAGLPIFFSLILSNLAFARRCWGVCAYGCYQNHL